MMTMVVIMTIIELIFSFTEIRQKNSLIPGLGGGEGVGNELNFSVYSKPF